MKKIYCNKKEWMLQFIHLLITPIWVLLYVNHWLLITNGYKWIISKNRSFIFLKGCDESIPFKTLSNCYLYLIHICFTFRMHWKHYSSCHSSGYTYMQKLDINILRSERKCIRKYLAKGWIPFSETSYSYSPWWIVC